MKGGLSKYASNIGLIIAFAAITTCIGAISYEAYTLFIVHKGSALKMPANFGNFDRVRRLLRDEPFKNEFPFAVIGDTRGYGSLGFGTFEKIMKHLKKENLSFLVLLGDCVYKGTPYFHMYLKTEWAEELAAPYPVFYVVGNHDIDNKRFPLSEFEKHYGPTIFSFEYHNNLFIFLRVLPKPYTNEESVAFLESMLPFDRDQYNKVFVFMHAPPLTQSTHRVKKVMNAERLLSLFKAIKADYVYAGDYHGYFREAHDGTDYIVTGGGGAELKDATFGRFHHAVIVTVRNGSVFEDILHVNSSGSIEDSVECLAMSEIYPFIKNNKILVLLLNIIVLAILVLASRTVISHLKAGKR